MRHAGLRHPADLTSDDVAGYLTHLADVARVSASTQRQAAAALQFLYREVLELPVDVPGAVLRPNQPTRLPVVLTRAEAVAVLREMTGPGRLVASLLYGSGLRLMEALQLRVKDVDLARHEISVRTGKGGHNRLTMLPQSLAPAVHRQVAAAARLHAADLRRGGGSVALPAAMARKSPGAARALAWQWLFPATRQYEDEETGTRRRHHLHPSAVQRAVAEAVRRALVSQIDDMPRKRAEIRVELDQARISLVLDHRRSLIGAR